MAAQFPTGPAQVPQLPIPPAPSHTRAAKEDPHPSPESVKTEIIRKCFEPFSTKMLTFRLSRIDPRSREAGLRPNSVPPQFRDQSGEVVMPPAHDQDPFQCPNPHAESNPHADPLATCPRMQNQNAS